MTYDSLHALGTILFSKDIFIRRVISTSKEWLRFLSMFDEIPSGPHELLGGDFFMARLTSSRENGLKGAARGGGLSRNSITFCWT